MINSRDIILVKIKYLFRDRINQIGLIVLLANLLAFLAMYLFVLQPSMDMYDDKRIKVSQLEYRINEKSKLEFTAKQYDRVAPVVDDVEEKLSISFSQAELTRKFDSIAKANNVAILNMSTKNGNTLAGYRSYINEITLSAKYPNIRQLIIALKELPGLNSIDEISFSKGADREAVSVMMILTTFRAAE